VRTDVRRSALVLACLLAATAAFAANPFYLDRAGVLWKAEATADGLILTGSREGVEVVSSSVPFGLGLTGVVDDQIQVVADEASGTVVVVWQRSWSETVSEVLMALWRDGAWLSIDRLSGDVFTNPRFPKIQLAQVATAADTGETVRDSFVQVLWWESGSEGHHGSLAIVPLTGVLDPIAAAAVYNLQDFIPIGISCRTPAPAEVLEHPLFADDGSRGRALIFYGDEGDCLFYLLEVTYGLEAASADPDGALDARATEIAQRRRHMPIFGVKKVFLLPQSFSLVNSRVVIGEDLVPVAYRVGDGQLEYVVNQGLEWSEPRTLPLRQDLTVDQAIPLVENLAR